MKKITGLSLTIFFSMFLIVMPLCAQEVLEAEVEMVIEDDIVNGKSQVQVFLKTENGVLTIDPREENINKLLKRKIKTGDKLVLEVVGPKGKIKNGEKLQLVDHLPDQAAQRVAKIKHVIPFKEKEASISSDGSGSSSPSGESASVAPSQRSVIAVLVAWPGRSVPSGGNTISNLWTGSKSTDMSYQESSYGQLGFISDRDGDGADDIFGPYLVNEPTDPCSWSQLKSMTTDIEQMLRNDNIPVDDWQHKLYVLPPELSCSWAGKASLGCSNSTCHAFINSKYDYWSVAYPHELGHNLNLHHATTDFDNNGSIDDEYGDDSSFMGNPNYNVHLNVAHKVEKSWMGSSVLVAGPGVYQVAPIDLDPAVASYPQALKVTIPNSSHVYYLSYRRPFNFDGSLSGGYNYKTHVHRDRGSTRTYLVGLMIDGGTFTDSVENLTFRQISHTDNYAEIEILGADPVDNQAPTIDMFSPLEGDQIAGIFTISVTADDSVGIDMVQMMVNASVVCEVPGNNGSSYSCDVDSRSLINGNYLVTAIAYDAAGNNAFSEANVTIDNGVPDTTPPQVAILAPLENQMVQDALEVQSQASDDVALESVSVQLDDIVQCSNLTVAPFNCVMDTTVVVNGLHTITATAFDVSGNSANDIIMVNVDNPEPLMITAFGVLNKKTSSIDVDVSTNMPAQVVVHYGLSASALNLSATNGDVQTAHTIVLAGLSEFTNYYYQVQALSGSGVEEIWSSVNSFKTLKKKGGKNNGTSSSGGFVIVDHSAENTTSSSAEIRVSTSENSTISVRLGLSRSDLSRQVTDSSFAVSHDLPLAGLNKSSRYYYQVEATSQTGEVVLSSVASFRTKNR